MSEIVWESPFVGWENAEEGNGQVKVRALGYRVTATEGDLVVVIDESTLDSANRVYTLPALENVPENVRVGWVQDALTPEGVAGVEARALSQLAEQATPTQGAIFYETSEPEPT